MPLFDTRIESNPFLLLFLNLFGNDSNHIVSQNKSKTYQTKVLTYKLFVILLHTELPAYPKVAKDTYHILLSPKWSFLKTLNSELLFTCNLLLTDFGVVKS